MRVHAFPFPPAPFFPINNCGLPVGLADGAGGWRRAGGTALWGYDPGGRFPPPRLSLLRDADSGSGEALA